MHRILRRVAGALCAPALGAVAAAGTAAGDPPNVLVILIDDVGLDQLAVYEDQNAWPGGDPYEYAQTPNIDALAQGGVRFTQARGNPLCSPTRAQLNSGRYSFRTGVGTIVKPEEASPVFREFSVAPAPDELLLPELDALAGWDRAWFGKWHLGLDAADGGSGPIHPGRVGWPHYAGALRNLNQEPNPGPIWLNGVLVGPGYNHWYRVEDGVTTTETTWATERQRLDCQDWILTQAQAPWLAVFALSAAHSPYDWPPDGTHTFPPLWPAGNEVLWDHYRALVENLDHELGELLFALGPVLDDTLVILVGDNGTPRAVLESVREEGQDLGGYDPLVDEHRFKGTPYEPGIRVPLIVSGPPVVQPGRSCDDLVDVVDVYETIRHAAGGAALDAARGVFVKDSVSLLPALRRPGAKSARRFSLAERFEPNGTPVPGAQAERAYASRPLQDQHLYKLVRRPGQPDEVYDLTLDPLEQLDLGTGHPAHAHLAAELQALVGP